MPVYNRPTEMGELLKSLSIQEYSNFEVIIVEDGSTEKSEHLVEEYSDSMELKYFNKQNTGPGDSRNFGATKSNGDYLVFFDSDCVIPADYLSTVEKYLERNKLDIYGGPDKAPAKPGAVQAAINYAMTSIITTGGIRGHTLAAKTFQPRSFNMGVTKNAFEGVGGFCDLHPGEDPDLVYRVSEKGLKKGLIPEASVYHKRRVNLPGFARQVYKFGLARTILMKWHPESRKFVFVLPTVMTWLGLAILIMGFSNPLFWYVLLGGLAIVLIDALIQTKNLYHAFLALLTTSLQISCYGWGFLKGWWHLFIRNKEEQAQFPEMFKGTKSEMV